MAMTKGVLCSILAHLPDDTRIEVEGFALSGVFQPAGKGLGVQLKSMELQDRLAELEADLELYARCHDATSPEMERRLEAFAADQSQQHLPE